MSRLRIGLTGGIGSGKSLVASLLARRGAAVVDADHVAHVLTAAGGAAMPALIDAFGAGICDASGALDRAAMRQRVFSRPDERARLEAILHPRIRQALREQAAQAQGEYVVLVVPLLVEHLAQWRADLDRVCVVDCPRELQIARVRARSGLDEQTIAAILAAQASREQRLAVADDVIDNSGTQAALQTQVDALHARYCRMRKN